MTGGVVLLLGGARAGKSTLAERMAVATGAPVTYIATATAGDDEMAVRIARHRAERPAHWRTCEEPVDLAGAVAAVDAEQTVVADCLTLWVSNLMEAGLDDEAIASRARDAAATCAAREGRTIVVSNEVGLGICPDNALARRYRDVLGRVNQVWASAAAEAYLVVAGRALPLSDPEVGKE